MVYTFIMYIYSAGRYNGFCCCAGGKDAEIRSDLIDFGPGIRLICLLSVLLRRRHYIHYAFSNQKISSVTCGGLNSRSGTVMRLNSALQFIEASSSAGQFRRYDQLF